MMNVAMCDCRCFVGKTGLPSGTILQKCNQSHDHLIQPAISFISTRRSLSNRKQNTIGKKWYKNRTPVSISQQSLPGKSFCMKLTSITGAKDLVLISSLQNSFWRKDRTIIEMAAFLHAAEFSLTTTCLNQSLGRHAGNKMSRHENGVTQNRNYFQITVWLS